MLEQQVSDLAISSAAAAVVVANDAAATVGSFSGEVWAPLGVGAIGAAILGALAEREDAVGAALRLVGRAVDVLVRGGISLTWTVLKTVVSASVGAVTGLIVGAITGPGPMLNALGESAKDKMVAKPEPAEPASEA